MNTCCVRITGCASIRARENGSSNQNHPIIRFSDFIRKALISQGFCEDRIVVHYIGVDTNFFSPVLEVRREPVVLFVARLVEKKGCEYLIQAMCEVQEAEPKAELVVDWRRRTS